MSLENVGGGLVAAALLAYLIYTLLRPERF